MSRQLPIMDLCRKRSLEGYRCTARPGHEGRCGRALWGNDGKHDMVFWWAGRRATNIPARPKAVIEMKAVDHFTEGVKWLGLCARAFVARLIAEQAAPHAWWDLRSE